jgi:hypothetical protein
VKPSSRSQIITTQPQNQTTNRNNDKMLEEEDVQELDLTIPVGAQLGRLELGII